VISDGRADLMSAIRSGKKLKKSSGPPSAEKKMEEMEKRNRTPSKKGNDPMSISQMAAQKAKTLNSGDLENKIKNRPGKKDLEEKNILKPGHPNIQAARELLKRAQSVDTLNNKLATRPPATELDAKLAPVKQRAEKGLGSSSSNQ